MTRCRTLVGKPAGHDGGNFFPRRPGSRGDREVPKSVRPEEGTRDKSGEEVPSTETYPY